jgi:hypothetical protein
MTDVLGFSHRLGVRDKFVIAFPPAVERVVEGRGPQATQNSGTKGNPLMVKPDFGNQGIG